MLRLLVIDADASRSQAIADGLRDCGRLETIGDAGGALLLLSASAWDVVVLVVGSLRDEPKVLTQLARPQPGRRVLLAVPEDAEGYPQEATLEAGIERFLLPTERVEQVASLRQAIGDKAPEPAVDARQAELDGLRSRVGAAPQAPVCFDLPVVFFRQYSTPSGARLFTYVSPSVESLLGLKATALLRDAAALDALVHAEDLPRWERARSLATSRRELLRFQGRFVLPSGRVRSLEVTAAPLSAAADSDLGWDGMITDVTERTELQSQLFLADRMATVGTLAASLTHEVSNPLSFVTTNLAALQSEFEQIGASAHLQELLAESIYGVNTIGQAVSNFRTFARSSGEKQRSLDLGEVVAAAVRMANNEIRHRASLELRAEPGVLVDADESALAQVLLTLLMFCAQSVQEGKAEQHKIAIETKAVGDHALVSVVATGPSAGAAQDALSSSDSAELQGRGLGGTSLYVCHRIVSTLGGEIRFGAETSGGTQDQVTITLPLAPGEAPQQAVTELPRSERTFRVLAVDDEELVLKAFSRALPGHEVLQAMSGREAIALLQTAGPFDLILCDVMMPDLTGADVYAAAQKARPGTEHQIVFVTGGAFTIAAQRFLDSVPNRRIEKPFSLPVIQGLLPQ